MPNFLQSQGTDLFNSIFQMIYLASFLFFMVYGQKVQVWMMLREIESAVIRLKSMKEDARRLAIVTIKETSAIDTDPTPRIDHFLEYFMILPTDLDPGGVVPKIEHVVDVREQRFRDEVKMLAPSAEESIVNNIEGVIEVALGLNQIYRIINHYYLLGKKTMSLYVIMQIQMQLPQIIEIAESYSAAVKAFAEGQPIGDGAGALVAAKMLQGYPSRDIAKETIVAERIFEGRKLYIIKAKGAGSTVGKPGDAVKKVIEENNGKVKMVIMIDAAGKLEGEKSGGTSEGTGAAIGGIGVEKFIIEEILVKHKIPIHAVIVKESIREAVAPMTKEIFEGTSVALARVRRIIKEGTVEDDTIIVAGIGNTVGIGQ